MRYRRRSARVILVDGARLGADRARAGVPDAAPAHPPAGLVGTL